MYAQNEFSLCQYTNMAQHSVNYWPYVHNRYYPAQECWQQVVPSSTDPIAAISTKRRESKEFVENFIKQCVEPTPSNGESHEDGKKALKIYEAREIVINVYRMQKKLETMSEELRNSENLSDSEWEKRWQECMALRDESTKLMNALECAEGGIDGLQKRVEQRRRKRCREKRKRAKWKAEKALAAEKRLRLHAEVDAWIQEKQDIIEREKQVELLRKDADMVLADVRGKRSDAKKFLGLLTELQNLRRIKINVARARGENLPLAADEAFENIIGQLLNQWTSLDREYSIEEQGLKLMLKTDSEQKIEKQKQSTFDLWETVLFGRKLQSYDPSRGDIHSLVMIRYAWDKYSNHIGKGSRIPIGWIMPVPPSSAAWQKCLRRK